MDLTSQHKNREVLADGPEVPVRPVRTRTSSGLVASGLALRPPHPRVEADQVVSVGQSPQAN
ncbi:hypothetical protein DMH04_18575 [Kibdelosporangium aridum]|uniref:Uncharacterized protein n=1 Tax=Kibdelosporangium aridum TaxID=2030 RepID=A0A428ZBC9_KIBAR|nr:hypothetical protein DMH04_18575 [Kibdelosporangium aridum]